MLKNFAMNDAYQSATFYGLLTDEEKHQLGLIRIEQR